MTDSITTWIMLLVTSGLVCVMSISLSRWMSRVEKMADDIMNEMKRNDVNILANHIENLRWQIDKAMREENYEIIDPLKKELKRSIGIYYRKRKEKENE